MTAGRESLLRSMAMAEREFLAHVSRTPDCMLSPAARLLKRSYEVDGLLPVDELAERRLARKKPG